MDRPITNKRSRSQRWLTPMVVILVLWMGGRSLFSFLAPAVARDRIHTVFVDRGEVIAGVQASGVLAPERETVVTSSIDSRILRILKSPGAAVSIGEPILELDTAASQLELGKLDEQLALKENAKRELDLDTARKVSKNETEQRINLLDLRHAESRLEQKEQLAAQGLLSSEELQQARLEVDKMRLRHDQFKEERGNDRALAQAKLAGLELELNILKKTREETRQRLERATTISPQTGVVTWTPPDVGSTVRQGEVIARIADLNAFKLVAGVSDFHAARIQTGMTAIIRVNQREIPGVVTRLPPSVEDGVFKFEVGFENHSEYALRSNMRAEVFVRTDSKQNVSRLRRSLAIPGPGRQSLFVVSGDSIHRRELEIGLAGMNHFEVLSGLNPGEEVVVSDMRRHDHLETLKLK